jgi:hypothetical protein
MGVVISAIAYVSSCICMEWVAILRIYIVWVGNYTIRNGCVG